MEALVEEHITKVITHFTLLSFDGECNVFLKKGKGIMKIETEKLINC